MANPRQRRPVIKVRNGLTIMPVRNPGHAATDWHMDLREYCTCPGCCIVWAHPETDDLQADWQWAQARYGPATTCPECGLTTAALPRRNFWREFAHGEYRYLVQQPSEREEEPEPRDDRSSCPPVPPPRSSDVARAAVPIAFTAATATPRHTAEQARATTRQDAFIRKARCKQLLGVVGIGLFILLTILPQLSR